MHLQGLVAVLTRHECVKPDGEIMAHEPQMACLNTGLQISMTGRCTYLTTCLTDVMQPVRDGPDGTVCLCVYQDWC